MDATRVRIQARGMNGELYPTTSIDLHMQLNYVLFVWYYSTSQEHATGDNIR